MLAELVWFCPDTMAHIYSLWPSDAIRRQRTESILAQVMACCLTAPSHYLNQCWLIIDKVLWHSSQDIIMRRSQNNNRYNNIENYIFRITLRSPRGQWINRDVVACYHWQKANPSTAKEWVAVDCFPVCMLPSSDYTCIVDQTGVQCYGLPVDLSRILFVYWLYHGISLTQYVSCYSIALVESACWLHGLVHIWHKDLCNHSDDVARSANTTLHLGPLFTNKSILDPAMVKEIYT